MLANPSPVKQAPDNRRLNKATQLILESMKLETPPMAQVYLEPGVNTKLNHRSKPKTNYTLPSDMPELPLGFVPTNKTPGANGEIGPIIPVRESMPESLLTMFSKIEAQSKETAQIEMVEKIVDKLDVGTMVANQMLDARKAEIEEKRYEGLIRHGFTEEEATGAMDTLRTEEAVKVAKSMPKPEPVMNVARTLLKTEAIVKSEEPPIEMAVRRGRPTDVERAAREGISVEELKMKVKGGRAAKKQALMGETGVTADELKEGRRLAGRKPEDVKKLLGM
jgi:hypothetical protein